MIDTLLILQIVIGVLLVIAILLQKTSTDGVASLGGGSNMNVVGAGSATNFISKATIFLVVVFMSNALVLANLSSKKDGSVLKKLQEAESKSESSAVPIAK